MDANKRMYELLEWPDSPRPKPKPVEAKDKTTEEKNVS